MRTELEYELAPEQPAQASALSTKINTQLLLIDLDEGVHCARLMSWNLRALDLKKLRAEITGLHTPGKPPAVMMSMRGLNSLPSSCLGTFAELSADLERIGGILVLYNLPKEITKILKKTKLDRVIQTAKARPQAKKRVLAAKKKYAELTQVRAA
ncbi:hypothetical protein COB72_03530 [bacterium]|nr:MAG: hypothetical protein COB72_03530 [bacterium]